jgi:hypothetical protein
MAPSPRNREGHSLEAVPGLLIGAIGVPAQILFVVAEPEARIHELTSYPVSCANAEYWSTITCSRPAENGCRIITSCCGTSVDDRSFSLSGAPIVNDPAGTTTISGQFSHYLSFGFSPRS